MVFSEFSTPGRLTTLQGKDTYLRIFGKHKLFLIDVFKKRHKFGWMGIVGVGVAEYYLNTWYEIIKELRKKKKTQQTQATGSPTSSGHTHPPPCPAEAASFCSFLSGLKWLN